MDQALICLVLAFRLLFLKSFKVFMSCSQENLSLSLI